MSEWISVKDRLPDKIGDYLVHMHYVPNGFGYAVCTYLGDEGIDGVYGFSVPESQRRNGGKITHWQPLPNPPKTGE